MDLTMTFNVPPNIMEGLSNGLYELKGGVVRQTLNKKVVAWLESTEALRDVEDLPLSPILSEMKLLSQISVGISLMNTVVTVAGIYYLSNKMDEYYLKISNQLNTIDKLAKDIRRSQINDHRANFQLGCVHMQDAKKTASNREGYLFEAIKCFGQSKCRAYLELKDMINNDGFVAGMELYELYLTEYYYSSLNKIECLYISGEIEHAMDEIRSFQMEFDELSFSAIRPKDPFDKVWTQIRKYNKQDTYGALRKCIRDGSDSIEASKNLLLFKEANNIHYMDIRAMIDASKRKEAIGLVLPAGK